MIYDKNSFLRAQALRMIDVAADSLTGARGSIVSLPASVLMPGHYANAQGNYAQANLDMYDRQIRRQLEDIATLPFRGASVRYAWGAIFGGPGSFDFSMIREHAAMLRGDQKLIVIVEVKSFHDDDASLVPRGLEGDFVNCTREGAHRVAALWRPHVMDVGITTAFRLLELARHPGIELVQFCGESATSVTPEDPDSDYTHEAYATQWLRFMNTVLPSYRERPLVVPLNSRVGDHAPMMLANLYALGGAKMSPDVFGDAGHSIFTGEIGGEDYRGRNMVNFAVASAPSLRKLGSANACLGHAQTFGVSHLSWVLSRDEPGQTRDDVLALLNQPVHIFDPSSIAPVEG